eukprot:scaffold823_cov397-Prasinococcus_capsulatus_cf.AAC.21
MLGTLSYGWLTLHELQERDTNARTTNNSLAGRVEKVNRRLNSYTLILGCAVVSRVVFPKATFPPYKLQRTKASVESLWLAADRVCDTGRYVEGTHTTQYASATVVGWSAG